MRNINKQRKSVEFDIKKFCIVIIFFSKIKIFPLNQKINVLYNQKKLF